MGEILLDKEALKHLQQELPRTVDQAVELLLRLIPPIERGKFSTMTADESFAFSRVFGMWIRNHFGLWGGNLDLMKDACSTHPDDASGVISSIFFDRIANPDSIAKYEPSEWTSGMRFIRAILVHRCERTEGDTTFVKPR